jgi:hypothetical protein
MTTHIFGEGPESTIPNDTDDPPRFGQPVETTKDVFVLELRKFFDRNDISASRLSEIPTIRKYDISTTPGEGSLETAVKLIQKFPDLDENLPLVAIMGSTGRNLPMGIGGQYVAPVARSSFISSANSEPFVLAADDTLVYKTTTDKKNEATSTIIFRNSRFSNIAQATSQEIIDEINFQSLYAKGVDDSGQVVLQYGGPLSLNVTGDIEIIGGTALSALGFTVGQKALYADSIPFHRFHQATSVDIAIEVASEDYNIRTELTDLVWSFFTFYMDTRDYMFLGRSIFDNSIPKEFYQIIIKVDPSISGEQEVPRPGDEKDKVFVNRINISVTTIQYTDRAVLIPGTSDPFYLDADGITFDDTIPRKN